MKILKNKSKAAIMSLSTVSIVAESFVFPSAHAQTPTKQTRAHKSVIPNPAESTPTEYWSNPINARLGEDHLLQETG
ncbi:MAG: hypothetical protein CW691_05400 [Candidatus Bathyarchaeum sp.]|nr:MAG: hypothetical protein CW691_05400 [Candidatus Bathyarchaeum sp.]